MEISLVTFPRTAVRVGVKSIGTIREFEAFLREEGASPGSRQSACLKGLRRPFPTFGMRERGRTSRPCVCAGAAGGRVRSQVAQFSLNAKPPSGGFLHSGVRKMDLSEIKSLLEQQGRDFEEFRKRTTPDQKKAEGKAVGDLEAKLDKINKALDKSRTACWCWATRSGSQDQRHGRRR